MVTSTWARTVGAVILNVAWLDDARGGTCSLPGWGAASPVPIDVYGAAVTSAGGLVYMAGGSSVAGGGITNQFRSYDVATDTWTSLAKIPTGVFGATLAHDAAGGRLFLFGGESRGETILNIVQVYDIAANTWSAGPPLPDPRWLMGSGVIGGMIYLVGGYSTFFVFSAADQNWEFNPAISTYTPRAVLPALLGGPGSATSGGRLYILGGRNANDQVVGTNYEYDATANSWAIRAGMPTPVNVPGSTALSGDASCNGDVILVGGGNPFLFGAQKDDPSRAVETTGISQIYDVATDLWSSGPTLSVPRAFLGTAQAGNTLMALGGHNGFFAVANADRIQGPPLPVALEGFSVE